MKAEDFNTNYFPTWCPGCGDYGIWSSLKNSLFNLNFKSDEFVVVYGIGCSGNMNDFIKSYGFHSLHGRGIPIAIGIKLANHELPVLVIGGDGDLLGEGGNHLIHAARGNFNITVIIHNNRVYGLTTGQASPTASKGYKSKSTPSGIIETPIRPLSLSIISGATFVAQGFAGDIAHLTDLITCAVKHNGFSIVNILQPCITFNKVNTYNWFRKKIYKIGKNYEKEDKMKALKIVSNEDKIPIGVIFKTKRSTYEESLPQIKNNPLIGKKLNIDVNSLLDEFV